MSWQTENTHQSFDGDMPVIDQPIRMVYCDTPERDIRDGIYTEIQPNLRNYLIDRLTQDPEAKQIGWETMLRADLKDRRVTTYITG